MGEAAAFWERHYASRAAGPTLRVNAQLEAFVRELEPASALDLGCGEGGDALWLAQRGWNVCAVDVATHALDRLNARAKEARIEGRVRTEAHDLANGFPLGRFALVSAHYLQSPVPMPRADILRSAAAAVKNGGYLLVVEHGSSSPWSWFPDARFPPPEELVEACALSTDDWVVHVSSARERLATGPKGTQARVSDNVLFAQRRHS